MHVHRVVVPVQVQPAAAGSARCGASAGRQVGDAGASPPPTIHASRARRRRSTAPRPRVPLRAAPLGRLAEADPLGADHHGGRRRAEAPRELAVQHVGRADELGDEARARAGRRARPASPPARAGPWLNTPMRSLIDSASCWSCVTKTKVMPSWRCRRLSSLCICSRSLRSSAPERLVEQQHLGLVDQRARQRHPLALAAGELRRLALRRRSGSCTSSSSSCGAPLALGAVDAAHHQRRRRRSRAIAHVREQRVVLEHGVHRRAVRAAGG